MQDQTPRAVRFQFLVGSVAIATLAIALTRFFLLDGYALPDVVAIHWNFGGQPDGAASVTELLLGLSGVALAPAVVASALVALRLPLQRHPSLLWGLPAVTTLLGALATCVSWSVATLNRQATRLQEVAPLPGSHVALVALLPVVLAIGVALLAQRLWPATNDEATPEPSIRREPLKQTLWLGRVNAHTWLWVGIPVSSLAAWSMVQVTGALWTLGIAAVSMFMSDAFSMLRVNVDRHGLRVVYGHLGVVRQLIPLHKIERATAVEVRPMTHGGWGYRGSLILFGKATVLVRGGEAIEVTQRNGRRFIVTVDDAATGAALLNAMASSEPRLSLPGA